MSEEYDDIATDFEDEPKDNKKTIMIAGGAAVLLCCCCSLIAGLWFFGDSLAVGF